MATVDAPPKRVAAAAAARGLGPLIAATKGSNPFGGFVLWLVLALISFGALVAINYPGSSSALVSWLAALGRPLSIVLLLAGLLCVVGAFVVLLTRFRRCYLYAGGLVRWQSGRVRVMAWSEIALIERLYGNVPGTATIRAGYKVIPAGKSKPLAIEASEGDREGDEMAARLEEFARAAGVYVS